MPIKFIRATESDKDYLIKLRKSTMLEHLEKSGQFLTEEEHLERLNHRYECTYLVLHRHRVMGAIKYRCTSAELELIQIQVHPQQQCKGYGTMIIRQVLDIGKGKTVKLSVLKENPAVRLYKKLGFQIVGKDHHEYHMQNRPKLV